MRKLKKLLEPFGITHYYTDGWGAYERHVEPDPHTVGKGKHPKDREQAHQLTTSNQALGTPDDLFLQNRAHTQSGDWMVHYNRYEFGRAL